MDIESGVPTPQDTPAVYGTSTARESTSGPRSGQPGRGRARRTKDRADFSVGGPSGSKQGNSNRNRNGKKPATGHQDGRSHVNGANGDVASAAPNGPADPSTSKPANSRSKGKGRGQKFNATLSENVAAQVESKAPNQKPSHRPKLAADADLTTSLIHGLSYPPYADCPICFNLIHPAQPTWSCSPPAEQCCWTTFHRKCIKPWAEKSVKELEDAWTARGERGKKGLWRCPGCQTKRQNIPGAYTCFCGSTPSPALTRLHTPHSCGNPCSRKRDCPHACPLACHPGPCPPCKVTLTQSCLCGSKQELTKCGEGSRSTTELTCDKPCGRSLPCGHTCTEGCHRQPCPPCTKIVPQKCVCGKVESQVVCGDKMDEIHCSQPCDKFFPCGTHTCNETCHSHPSFLRCPSHPDSVPRCPCGSHPIQPFSQDFFVSSPNKDLVLPRQQCTDPIPTCTSTCNKPLPPSLCSSDIPHTCQMKCHLGPCTQPCMNKITVPCRCGSISKTIFCSDLALDENADGPGARSIGGELLCNKPCSALRYCGRHMCNRMCCPLASLGKVKGKSKGKKMGAALGSDVDALDLDPRGLHICDLDCGKLLSCGLHHCEAKDHTGPCAPCYRSTFEEVICDCGMTTLEPPVPCGTVLTCPYPCTRPPPPCGHPRSLHGCHGRARHAQITAENGEEEDPRSGCPPCLFLTDRLCACGKKMVPNKPCSTARDKVLCGIVCGKTLGCGFHKCEKTCHSDDCGTCTAPCGKPRKLCGHLCTLPCHAPSSCPEDRDNPCKQIITLTCPCGRIQQSAHCNRSTATPTTGRGSATDTASRGPKCNDDCAKAQRNARLAAALNIEPKDKKDGEGVVWKDETVVFARANAKFVTLVEKTFEDFLRSDKKNQVLPHMPIEKRKFVMEVAAGYRMDTQMVDQEPHRSVQVLRRIDSRSPRPLLSKHITSAPSPSPSPGPGLGRLATKLPPASSGWGNTTRATPVSSTAWLTAKPGESSGLSRDSSSSELAKEAPSAGSWMAKRAEFLKNARESQAAKQDDKTEVVEKPATDDWEDDEEV